MVILSPRFSYSAASALLCIMQYVVYIVLLAAVLALLHSYYCSLWLNDIGMELFMPRHYACMLQVFNAKILHVHAKYCSSPFNSLVGD